MKKKWISIYLDLLAFPTLFLSKKRNAWYHLRFICPRCPEDRRKTRDVTNIGECWWYTQWKNAVYDIPKNFGMKNLVREYREKELDLKPFKKFILKQKPFKVAKKMLKK